MYFTNPFLKSFILLSLFFLTAASVKSQDSSMAKILAVQGAVQLTRIASDGNSVTFDKLSPGTNLFFGDVIKTKADGRLTIALRDNSQAIIGENTIVEIKDTGNSPRTIFNVLRGKTRIKIEKMGGRPNPYRVTTPTTVIAVRGTIFDVFVKGDKTEVFVTEGEVSVTNLLTPVWEVTLQPGQFTRVEREMPPQNPAPFNRKRNDDFFNRSRDSSDRRETSNDVDKNGSDRHTDSNRDQSPGKTNDQNQRNKPNKKGSGKGND